jgi:CheY-like chemotaxis protein
MLSARRPKILYAVLSIEDSPFLSALLGTWLKREDGFDLVHVGRLDDAIDKLREQQYTAILLDLNLPDSKGLDTAKSIRKQTKTPVCVLTGVDGDEFDELRIQLGKLGITRVLSKTKTKDPASIADAIIDCAAEERPSLMYSGKAAITKRRVKEGTSERQFALWIAAGTSVTFIIMFIVGWSLDAMIQLRSGQYTFPQWAMLVVSPALCLMIHHLWKNSKDNNNS